MAVFLLNICKFNKCGLEFGTLVDLIQHIEENHIGELSQTLTRPYSLFIALRVPINQKNILYIVESIWKLQSTCSLLFPTQIMIQSRSPIVFHWAAFSGSSRTQRVKRIPSFSSARVQLSHLIEPVMPVSGWKLSVKSPSNITAIVCPLRIEVILQQVCHHLALIKVVFCVRNEAATNTQKSPSAAIGITKLQARYSTWICRRERGMKRWRWKKVFGDGEK